MAFVLCILAEKTSSTYTIFTQFLLCFILLIHEGLQRKEVYQEFPPSYAIFHRSVAEGCLDLRFHASTANTAQLLTLHQHRANNQCIGDGYN